jgi:lipoprotein-releasing system permease protein
MIISVSILNGFQESIKNKIFDFSGHINVSDFGNGLSFKNYPINLDQGIYSKYKEISEIDAVIPFIMLSALIEKNNNSDGLVYKGVNEEYLTKIIPHLSSFNNSISFTNSIIISESQSERLNIFLSDTISLFFPNDPPIFRKLIVKGIYDTGLEEFDDSFVIGDINLGRKIYSWDSNLASGLNIYLKDASQTNSVLTKIKKKSFYNEFLETSQSKYSQVFDWLGLLDKNVIIFFIILSFVACFNMISVILIFIMDKIKTIGILKSFGTNNSIIYSIFYRAGTEILIKSILISNFLAYVFIFLQSRYKIIGLDKDNYYLDFVPIKFEFSKIIILNISLILIILISIYIPIYFIGKISINDNVKFN